MVITPARQNAAADWSLLGGDFIHASLLMLVDE
jgi:hypothetical protein